jgi:hypothetical protein
VRGFTASRIVPEASETYALVALQATGNSAPWDRHEIFWQKVLHDGLPWLRDLHLADVEWIVELNSPAADIPVALLVRWWTGQLNELFTEITDLGRYRDSEGVLDARNAFRELRTLDRIIGNCVRIQANADDHVGRLAAAFEFFDLFPNLLPQEMEAKRVWSALADPKAAASTLRSAFTRVPEPIKSVLIERVDRVTSKLRDWSSSTSSPSSPTPPARSTVSGFSLGSRPPKPCRRAYPRWMGQREGAERK